MNLWSNMFVHPVFGIMDAQVSIWNDCQLSDFRVCHEVPLISVGWGHWWYCLFRLISPLTVVVSIEYLCCKCTTRWCCPTGDNEVSWYYECHYGWWLFSYVMIMFDNVYMSYRGTYGMFTHTLGMCVCACIHTHLHTQKYTHTHIRSHTTYTHTHTHTP